MESAPIDLIKINHGELILDCPQSSLYRHLSSMLWKPLFTRLPEALFFLGRKTFKIWLEICGDAL